MTSPVMQLDMLGQFEEPGHGLPPPPWPPALVCEPYGTAGNWRIRCSLPGHAPGFGLWGGPEAQNRKAARDHQWWHDTEGGRLVPFPERKPGQCLAWTPEGICEWGAADHLAREPMDLQPDVHQARQGAYRGRGTEKAWHAYTPERSS